MKFSITNSLLERNEILIKEILRLRKKNNKLIQELKLEKRKAIRLSSTSVSTQTSPDIHQIPKSPISREKKPAGPFYTRMNSTTTTTPSPINTRLVKASPQNSHTLLETYVSPARTSFLPQKEKIVSPPHDEDDNEDTIHDGIQLQFEDDQSPQQILSLDDVHITPRRSRRSSMTTPLSYKEPSLIKKVRKGHQFFTKK
mgnify:FL=1